MILSKIEEIGEYVLDPRSYFVDDLKRPFLVEKDGVALYRDAHHLSATGTKMMIGPFLRDSAVLLGADPVHDND